MKKYINTTIIGGLAAVLPLVLLIVLVRWIINVIGNILQPLVELFNTDSQYLLLAIYVIAVIAILILFFLVGWFIQTRIGNFLRNVLERKYLMKIPGYRTAKEIVMQFFGGSRSFFSEVVLVDIFDSGTLMTGFITDDQGEIITVFVPTGPNPTSGNIYHVSKDRVIKTNASVDSGMRSIISCGAGSNELFQKADNSNKKESGNEIA
ncbi:MAG: DUF502 domain-containing protein [Bacteroidales bacterium]